MGAEDTSDNTMSGAATTGLTKTAISNKISTKIKDAIGIQRGGNAIKTKLYDLIARFQASTNNVRNIGEDIRQN